MYAYVDVPCAIIVGHAISNGSCKITAIVALQVS